MSKRSRKKKSGCEESLVSKEADNKESTKENEGALKNKGMQYCVCVKRKRVSLLYYSLVWDLSALAGGLCLQEQEKRV